MNALVAIPLPLRLTALFVLGAVVGAAANWAADRLSWSPRGASPWRRRGDLPPVGWSDRLPIVGWFGLRRESKQHGEGFWLRPLLVELLSGGLFALLYWWEVVEQGLYRPPLIIALNAPPPEFVARLHLQLGAHLVLVAFMLVASLVDISERVIPDAVTIPGTLVGLGLATIAPACLLPDVVPLGAGNFDFMEFLKISSPQPWPQTMDAWPNIVSLAIALACVALWCVGLLPRPWRTRHGLGRAASILLARITRERFSLLVLALSVALAVWVAAVWFVGGRAWEGLASALVGLAAGGGIVWCVRIIGARVLGREAMGFGDVTLMAMIGTLVGWQSCLVIFFLAPFFGLGVGAAQWIVRRESEIYYGPFLCLATLAVLAGWGTIWDRGLPLFGAGWLVPTVVVVCLALMVVLLSLWRAILRLFVHD